jgi:hypothetical protein
LSVGDAVTLPALVAAHSGALLPQNVAQPVALYSVNGDTKPLSTNNGAYESVHIPRVGNELILVSHNFCDPTTWYTESERSTEALTDSGNGLTWASNNTFWIDMTHGKLFDEDALVLDAVHGYAVTVIVDGVTQVARVPFVDAGGDYVVDYADGTITFAASQAGKAVSASYSFANGSEWVARPSAGFMVDVEKAEVQFSKNAVINDDAIFEVWGYNPADLPNKMMYRRTSYKKMVNYIDEALGSYPVVPAIGGVKRGTQQEIYGFPFRYETVKRLKSSQGLEIRVRLKNDMSFGGEHCTASLYCTVSAE